MVHAVFFSTLASLLIVACARSGPSAELPGIQYAFDDLWDYNKPAETERAFNELLAIVRKADKDYRAQLLTQIARAQGLQNRFDEAHATLDAAEKLASDKTPVARVRVLLERGRAFNSAGRKDEATPLFQKAYDDAKALGVDFYTVDAAHMMGIVTAGDASVRWNETALDIARNSEDERARRWRASLLNNLGWTYFDMGRHDASLRLFGEALAERIERGEPEPIFIAKWCVARTLRALGKTENALMMQQQILADRAEAGMPEDGYVSEEIAENLAALNRAAEAAPFAAKAYELLSSDPWFVKNEPARLERVRALATSAP